MRTVHEPSFKEVTQASKGQRITIVVLVLVVFLVANRNMLSNPSLFMVFFLVPVFAAVGLVYAHQTAPVKVEVKDGILHLEAAYVWKRRIPLDQVTECYVSPVPWRSRTNRGLRLGPRGERIVHASGGEVVMVHCVNGKRYAVGSLRPEELRSAILRGMH